MASDNNSESLEQKARSLELLYSVVSTINLMDDQQKMTLRILEILKDWMSADSISFYRNVDSNELDLVMAVGEDFEASCHPGKSATCPCRDAIAKGHAQSSNASQSCCGMAFAPGCGSSLCLISVPLQTRNRVLGLINLFVSRENLEREEDWVVVLTSIGQNLGLVIERAELEIGSERLSRMEERTSLAHELHDSLAQTLASIRYNVRILDNALQGRETAESKKLLDVVDNSVEEANRELRELISRFRSAEDQPSLIPSLEEVIEKFMGQTGTRTVFQNSIEGIDLPSEFESQIVRIVQEALANARKHARARTVRVMLRSEGGEYHVLIEDDGVGFDDSKQVSSPRDHIGLQVMRERAAKIGGDLSVESVPGDGTRVHLVFCHSHSRS